MTHCAECGMEITTGQELCAHHPTSTGDRDWAHTNRIMCGLLHHGVVPVRLPPTERSEKPESLD